MRASVSHKKKNVLKIISTSSLISNYLAKILPLFLKENKGVNVEITSIDSYKNLKEHSYDVALLPRTAHNTPLIQSELFTMKLRLYASNEYISKHGFITDIQDIQNHSLITFGLQSKFDLGLSSWPLCALENPYQIKSHISVNCVNTMIQFAEDGLGIIGISDRFIKMKNSKLKNICSDIHQDNVTICIMYPSESLNMSLIHIFKAFLLSIEKKS